MLYDDKNFIGKVIKIARKNAKLSQAQLSEMIDMSDKNLGNIENGKQFPAVNNFLKIIEVLNLSLEDFGVKNITKHATSKDRLIGIILGASENKCRAFLDIIKTSDKYIKN